jgi:hypothetical protein
MFWRWRNGELQPLVQRIHIGVEQDRRCAHSFAELHVSHDREAQRANIEGDMARIDLDEYVGHLMHPSSDGVHEPEQRAQYPARVGALGQGETCQLTDAATLAARVLNNRTMRYIGPQIHGVRPAAA